MMARAYLLLGVSVVLLALTAAIDSSTGTALAKPAWASTTDGCLSCHEPGISDSGIYLDEHDGAVGQCLVCHLVPGSKIHGTWGDTADACARCHRTHTAAADGLLIDDADNLCLFCHGSEPGNAQTNVSDGRLRYNDGSLRGGGFQQATMNTGTNAGNATDSWQFPVSLATANPTTSTHSLGISAGIWGSGSINGTAAIPFENTTRLECISCHDPHEFNQTYRMLRKQPVDSAIDYRGSTEFAFVTDQLAYASVNISSGILAYDIGDYTEVEYAAPDVYSDNGTLMMVSFPGTHHRQQPLNTASS